MIKENRKINDSFPLLFLPLRCLIAKFGTRNFNCVDLKKNNWKQKLMIRYPNGMLCNERNSRR